MKNTKRIKHRDPVARAALARGRWGAGSHGKAGRARNRADRQATKRALRRGGDD